MPVTRYFFQMAGGMPVVTSPAEIDAATVPPASGQAWEMARYRAYQAHLVGYTIGETFGQTVAFLTLTGANTASTTAIRADM
jgi:hypothetical protein